MTKLKTVLTNLGLFILITISNFSHPHPTYAYNPTLFVTRWQTNVVGATEPTKVTLNFLKNATDEYEISWRCNDDFVSVSSNKVSYDYGETGTYDICVRSSAPLHFYAPDLADDEKAKLLEIKQWGTIPWSSFMSAFKDMVNIQLTASDIPDLSQVTDMSSAFQGATNFTGNGSMDSWNTSGVKNMANTFVDAQNFNAPIGNWDTSAVTTMNSMFYRAINFNQYIGAWQTGAVGNMAYMFFEAANFNNGEVPGESTKPLEWNTSNVTNMKQMFNKASSFNQDINNWQTGLVRDMYAMFAGATVFNQDIGGWNTSEVINMGSMFTQAYAFNQDISNWQTGKATSMTSMFKQATAFNQNIGSWNTGNVTNMSYMFDGATNFNNGDAPGVSNSPLGWNTSKVINMRQMFGSASSFNQDINSWQTGTVKDMYFMFSSATAFNQHIGNWQTGNVTNMGGMFARASAFNQDISAWNIGAVKNFIHFLSNSGMQPDNYDKLLNSWSNKTEQQGLTFRADKVYYCNPEPGRSNLKNINKWTIIDAGQKCPPQNLNLSPNQIDEGKTTVGTITSTSEGTVTYSFVSGEGSEDNTKFSLDSDTGALVFLEAPDYENPSGQADPENDNKYTIRIRATDTSNNLYSETTFIITVIDVDELPPVISINEPESKLSNQPITTTFTVSDHFSIDTVEVADASTATTNNLVCDSDNHLMRNCTVDVTSSGTLVLQATDKAGHTSTATQEGYVIDTIKPTFTTSNIDTTTHNLHQPIIEFEAFDTVGIQKYEIKYIDHNGNNVVKEIEYRPSLIQETLEFDPREDQHTITIIAYDLAGNATEKQTVFPPTVVFNTPTTISNQTINNSTVTITSPITGNKIDNITLSGTASKGVYLEDCSDINGEDSPYNTSVTCKIRNVHNSGTLTIQAEDINNGATGYNSHTYTIDSLQPTATSTSSNNHNQNNSNSDSQCHNQTPGSPVIYSAVAQNAHSILLSFRPADKPVEKYILQYGTKSGSYPYGSQNLGVNSSDSMTYAVNLLAPNTTYYFRIKAANGCATGDWSNEISATTKALIGFNQLETITLGMSTLDPLESSDCQTYTTQSGDTLWSIAKQFLGNGSQFQQIIDQNSDEYPTLKKNLLQPGWTLKINCSSIGNKDESSLESGSGLKVQVKVVDTKNNPIENAKVTIHSKVQEAWTNSEGIAEFNQVEPGDHKVIIDHDNYQGEQNINLSDNPEIKIHRLDIVVKKQKFNFSPWLILPVVIILLFLIYRRKREER